MPTINQIARERKRLFETLKRADRTVDTIQEAIQRHIQRVIDRKRKFPELEDVSELAELAQVLDGAVETLVSQIEAVNRFFRSPDSNINEVAGIGDFFRRLAGRTGRNIVALRDRNTGGIITVRFKSEAELRRWLDENPGFEFVYDLRQGGRGEELLESANP